ncbi:MAG: hypothetical protein RR499_02335 [Mucinivorans sp.]
MIRRALHIFLALLTATTILMGSTLPHHHHADNEVCFSFSLNPSSHPGQHDSSDCPIEKNAASPIALETHSHAHGNKCLLCAEGDNDLLPVIHLPVLLACMQVSDFQILVQAHPYTFAIAPFVDALSFSILDAPLRAPPVA